MMVNVGNLIRRIHFFRSLGSNHRPKNFFPTLVSFFVLRAIICHAATIISTPLTAVPRGPRVTSSAPRDTFGRLWCRCRKSRNHCARAFATIDWEMYFRGYAHALCDRSMESEGCCKTVALLLRWFLLSNFLFRDINI